MKLQLLTSNVNKFVDIREMLDQLDIELLVKDIDLIEVQTLCTEESTKQKAINAAEKIGYPVLVDDVSLYLDTYPHFPGPLFKHTLKGIGINGLKALLRGKSASARMVCGLSIAIGDNVYYWQGEVQGSIDCNAEISNPKMILSSIFKCSDGRALSMRHRLLAFEQLSLALISIRAALGKLTTAPIKCNINAARNCEFCAEIDDIDDSLFSSLLGLEISNRMIYEDDDFIILVPIGLFIEGGLQVLSRAHVPSFSFLDTEKLNALTRLVDKIKSTVKHLWGVSPIVFEHASSLQKSKGRCCVDHAHLNIFPASMDIYTKLSDRFPYPTSNLSELTGFRSLPEGYLYVDTEEGAFIYDGTMIPTQLVRRHIIESLGYPEQWHWRECMGVKKMKATLEKLKDFKL